jgi:hypothetical protein
VKFTYLSVLPSIFNENTNTSFSIIIELYLEVKRDDEMLCQEEEKTPWYLLTVLTMANKKKGSDGLRRGVRKLMGGNLKLAWAD